MTEAEFTLLRDFLRAGSGLELGPEKRYLAESRLRPVWESLGLSSLGELARSLGKPGRQRLGQAVLDAMATHETLFFRDRSAFEALERKVLPRLIAARAAERRLRIWSAAASTGQEAYSLAMLLADHGPALAGWNVDLVGTDLSAEAIERARRGTYSQFEVQRGLPIRMLLRHFDQGPEGWTVSPSLRGAVEWRVHNLLEPFSRFGRFDLILCRNLLIYLDRPSKAALLDRLLSSLAPDGLLCLGAAETPLGLSDRIEPDPEIPPLFRRKPAFRPGVLRIAS